jgi:hypothetical protein
MRRPNYLMLGYVQEAINQVKDAMHETDDDQLALQLGNVHDLLLEALERTEALYSSRQAGEEPPGGAA